MSAATDSRNSHGTGTDLKYGELEQAFNGPAAAAVNLPVGAVGAALLADTDPAGPVIYPFTAAASKIALGFIDVGGDNTSGVQGAIPVRVRQRTGLLVDLNAGGGSAIAQTDKYKPAYLADNQTCSKLAADGELGGMIMGLDAATGLPVVGVGPMFAALAKSMGVVLGFRTALTTFTQTYATAVATNPAATTHAIADSSGGAASTTTIASLTTGGGTYPDATPVKNAIATLAAEAELVKADILAVKKLANSIIDLLQAAGLAL